MPCYIQIDFKIYLKIDQLKGKNVLVYFKGFPIWSKLNVYSDCIKECHNDFSESRSFVRMESEYTYQTGTCKIKKEINIEIL